MTVFIICLELRSLWPPVCCHVAFYQFSYVNQYSQQSSRLALWLVCYVTWINMLLLIHVTGLFYWRQEKLRFFAQSPDDCVQVNIVCPVDVVSWVNMIFQFHFISCTRLSISQIPRVESWFFFLNISYCVRCPLLMLSCVVFVAVM